MTREDGLAGFSIEAVARARAGKPAIYAGGPIDPLAARGLRRVQEQMLTSIQARSKATSAFLTSLFDFWRRSSRAGVS